MIAIATSPAELVKAAVFVTLLAGLLAAEAWRPRRAAPAGWKRRARNVTMIAIATAGQRLAFPLGTIGFAAAWPYGLLHAVVVPPPVAWVLSVVALDLAIYWQHRAFHASDLLWRVHRVHHSDTAFDATLGVRFHPLEIWLSLAYKLLVVAALGAPAGAVAVYESALLASSLATHANLALPRPLDRALRSVVVTPDWHRVHHSIHADETNSNFASILSLWDRWFRTAREQPRDGHTSMRIGLAGLREPAAQRLLALLVRQPLASDPAVAAADASTE